MKSKPHSGAPDAQPKPLTISRRCPSCGKEAEALFYPIHPLPGEHLEDRVRPLVCPNCCPPPPDETKS